MLPVLGHHGQHPPCGGKAHRGGLPVRGCAGLLAGCSSSSTAASSGSGGSGAASGGRKHRRGVRFPAEPPVETLVTVPVVAEIEQVECVRRDPVPYEPVTYQVPLDAELQSYTEKMCDLYDVPLELAYAVMQVESDLPRGAQLYRGLWIDADKQHQRRVAQR